MTILPYLGLLSVGSPLHQQRTPWQLEEELSTLRYHADAHRRAELQVLATLNLYNPPTGSISPRKLKIKQQKDSINGLVVAIGTMLTNYGVCFPIVVFRHGLQALSIPSKNSSTQDTPYKCLAQLRQKYHRHGFRGLYGGFGLGLGSQAITAAYESFLSKLAKKLSAKLDRSYQRHLLTAIHKCLRYAIHIPLYSLSKTALVLRVQPHHQPLIHSPGDFLRYFAHDLLHPGPFFWSSFLPSFSFNLATETCMMSLYKWTYRHLGKQRSTMLQSYYPEILCGMSSSMATRALVYPMDTVIFKLMIQDTRLDSPDQQHYTGFFDCCRTIYQQAGWQGFFSGWGAGVLELTATWLILEASWWAYRLLDKRLVAEDRRSLD
ncbi:mitochondrial carrier domain-containing protein [Chlamydoabsidia padenii]|nr:mitochondrial carrier domain-containing protein [Chlamydoabsidia padenii]